MPTKTAQGVCRAIGTDNACLMQVIVTTALCGFGTPDDPARRIMQYWDLQGNLLAVNDPLSELKEIPKNDEPDNA